MGPLYFPRIPPPKEGDALQLDFAQGIPQTPLNREQRIILDRRLRELRDLESKARKYYVSFVTHLGYIEEMENILRKLRGELIYLENQQRLET